LRYNSGSKKTSRKTVQLRVNEYITPPQWGGQGLIIEHHGKKKEDGQGVRRVQGEDAYMWGK